ncbi:1-deoxy-D-xylulose-5-phosphate synthase [Candidatus Anstonella stagnisolia]|nr:1-deoxy-D-xylulose-5-phosphate synthase [Candidatus Anstonella stagnisolia]
MGIIEEKGERHYSIEEMQKAANEMRGYSLISIYCAGSGHSGGVLSSMDVLSVLFLRVMKHKPSEPEWDARDRLFFSVGHKAPAWYVPLGYCGYFDVKQVATLRKLGSPFQGHPDWKKCEGIELSCGSLGQGLSVAVGDALAARLDGKEYRVFCLMGDGEQQEGQIWEAAMEAGHYKLDNLIGIVDKNELQIDGKVKDVMDIDPIDEKYRAFGWNVIVCNGHDVKELLAAFEGAMRTKGKPTVIIAKTVKGKGVSFMENQAGWHGRAPNREQLDAALKELKVEYLPKDEMIKIAKEWQEKANGEIDALMPKFSKDYWWNAQEKMKVEMKPTRMGFGEELHENENPNVVALGADISGSICINMFHEKKPERKSRFFSVGIAEQSGTCVAAGLAKEGKIPFFGTYGVFAAGRALDQLRTTVAYGGWNVKIVGAHGGVSVGPDGATHQALEEIFQIAGLPNMNLLVPCDSIETKKTTHAMIDEIDGPCYVRFAREATPIVTKDSTPYKFGSATVVHYRGEQAQFTDAFETVLSKDAKNEREDIAIIACGPEVAEAMRAAWILKEEFKVNARIVNISTVKPLDKDAVVRAAKETGAVLTAEEHQKGGLGNLVSSAIMCDEGAYGHPVVFGMIGVEDKFGESGAPWELIKKFGLSAEHIAKKAHEMVQKKKK